MSTKKRYVGRRVLVSEEGGCCDEDRQPRKFDYGFEAQCLGESIGQGTRRSGMLSRSDTKFKSNWKEATGEEKRERKEGPRSDIQGWTVVIGRGGGP